MPKWCLIQIRNAHSSSEVGRFVGRKVVVNFEENKFVGKILGVHGKNGVVKARFNRGLPGKAIGAIAEIIG
jgi:large subunit ribosomal protein L35Ae